MKNEPTKREKIDMAVDDLKNALLENILASQAEVDAKLRKSQAYHVLLKAKERMRAIEQELMDL